LYRLTKEQKEHVGRLVDQRDSCLVWRSLST